MTNKSYLHSAETAHKIIILGETTMKIKKIIAIFLALLTCALLFASCGSKALEGKYKGKGVMSATTYEFKKDGTVVYTGTWGSDMTGTYKINGKEIEFDFGDGGGFGSPSGTYDFSTKGDKIIISYLEYSKVD